MSALAMMLSATLVAGSAPEKVRGETRQVLDLSGEWEGTYVFAMVAHKIRVTRGAVWFQNGAHSLFRVVDNGREPPCVMWDDVAHDDCTCEVKADRAVITFLKKAVMGYPARLELRRVKPRK